jgi:hypothetical protein
MMRAFKQTKKKEEIAASFSFVISDVASDSSDSRDLHFSFFVMQS